MSDLISVALLKRWILKELDTKGSKFYDCPYQRKRAINVFRELKGKKPLRYVNKNITDNFRKYVEEQ